MKDFPEDAGGKNQTGMDVSGDSANPAS